MCLGRFFVTATHKLASKSAITSRMSIFKKGPLLSPAAQREIEAARSESRREVFQAIARGQVAQERKEEAKKPAPLPAKYHGFDATGYAAAKERLRQYDEIVAVIDAEHEAATRAINDEIRRREKWRQTLARARKLLKDTEPIAREVAARKRRGDR